MAEEQGSPLSVLSPEMQELQNQWKKEQLALAAKIVVEDKAAGFLMPWEKESKPTIPGCAPIKAQNAKQTPPLSIIGGLDISFVKDSNVAVASLVVLDYPGMTIRRTLMHHCEMKLPYMAGYLAFREVDPLVKVIEQCRQKFPQDVPQILFIDGNGVLHFRGCGLASHLGVVVDIPCVGSAKKLLAVDGLQRDEIHAALDARKPEQKKDLLPLVGNSGTTLGYAALTGNSTKQPIYISAGHRISQHSAAKLVSTMCPNRVPEPIRQADLQSRAYIKDHLGHINKLDEKTVQVKAKDIPPGGAPAEPKQQQHAGGVKQEKMKNNVSHAPVAGGGGQTTAGPENKMGDQQQTKDGKNSKNFTSKGNEDQAVGNSKNSSSKQAAAPNTEGKNINKNSNDQQQASKKNAKGGAPQVKAQVVQKEEPVVPQSTPKTKKKKKNNDGWKVVK